MQAASAPLAAAIDQSAERLARGGRLIYLGTGTSGRISGQDAAELPPTFHWPYERAINLMAGGQDAIIRAVEGAEDSEERAIAALDEVGVCADDVVIGLASSGQYRAGNARRRRWQFAPRHRVISRTPHSPIQPLAARSAL